MDQGTPDNILVRQPLTPDTKPTTIEDMIAVGEAFGLNIREIRDAMTLEGMQAIHTLWAETFAGITPSEQSIDNVVTALVDLTTAGQRQILMRDQLAEMRENIGMLLRTIISIQQVASVEIALINLKQMAAARPPVIDSKTINLYLMLLLNTIDRITAEQAGQEEPEQEIKLPDLNEALVRGAQLLNPPIDEGVVSHNGTEEQNNHRENINPTRFTLVKQFPKGEGNIGPERIHIAINDEVFELRGSSVIETVLTLLKLDTGEGLSSEALAKELGIANKHKLPVKIFNVNATMRGQTEGKIQIVNLTPPINGVIRPAHYQLVRLDHANRNQD